MSEKNRRLLPNAILTLVLAILLVFETASFAWLSTSWNNGEFSITTDVENTPRLELWTYHNTAADDSNPIGWYLTYADDSSLSASAVPKEKAVTNIRTESDGSTTFTKSGDYSLYFGTINNLVQTEDNQPVYIKLSITLPKMSTNVFNISYSLPESYINAFYLDPKTNEYSSTLQDTTLNTSFQTMVTLLQDKTKYSFLTLQCYKNLSASEYSVSDDHKLPTGFADLFLESSAELSVIDPANLATTFNLENNTLAEQTVYIYFKFSVSTQALQDALLDTDLKTFMPIYLVFNISLDFEMTTNAKN